VVPAAAGGPKGLVLGPLDRFIFGDWLASSSQPVHLVGASIGAWRMATACLNDPVQAFQRLESDYIRQHLQARISAWSRAVAASQQLAHEWQAWLARPDMALVDSL